MNNVVLSIVIGPKDADGIASSVDPDQTSPQVLRRTDRYKMAILSIPEWLSQSTTKSKWPVNPVKIHISHDMTKPTK